MADPQYKPRRGRPPKNSAHREETKRILIRSGLEMLTERGYMTSDIDSILKKVNIPKGSFYYYFTSKEAFGYALLDSYADYFAHKLDKHLNNSNYSPLDRIYQFYEDAKNGLQKYHFKRGCLVGNLGQEITALPDGFRSRLNDILSNWQNKIASCLIEAQQHGQISTVANCQILATFFWIGWEGAVMRAKLAKDVQPLTIFIDNFMSGLPN